MTTVAYKCNVCDDIIFARAPTDSRYCSCGAILMLRDREILGAHQIVEVEVPFTKEQLYEDWNFAEDKLGIIYGDESYSGSKKILAVYREDSGRYKARLAC